MLSYGYEFNHLDIRELRGGPALRLDGEHTLGALISSPTAKKFSARTGGFYFVYGEPGSYQGVAFLGLSWLPVRKLKLSAEATLDNRQYYQQYVSTLRRGEQAIYLVSDIDHRSASFTFRGEIFFTPEISLQYYGSPYYSVGNYSDFSRINNASAKEINHRLEPLATQFDPQLNSYTFSYDSEEWNFNNPDFSFMQFRSNLVFRWEYNLGSTLYLVWAHDRSGHESIFQPVTDITGDLFGIKGNHVFMLKLNFWFSV